jgi:hypothetical protein
MKIAIVFLTSTRQWRFNESVTAGEDVIDAEFRHHRRRGRALAGVRRAGGTALSKDE